MTLQYRSSEQTWRPPLVEANMFLPNKGLQTYAGLLPLLPRKRLLFPRTCELRSPAWGKSASWRSFLRGCFSGAGSELGDPNSQGKTKPHPHELALEENSSEPVCQEQFLLLRNLTLCVKVHTQ